MAFPFKAIFAGILAGAALYFVPFGFPFFFFFFFFFFVWRFFFAPWWWRPWAFRGRYPYRRWAHHGGPDPIDGDETVERPVAGEERHYKVS